AAPSPPSADATKEIEHRLTALDSAASARAALDVVLHAWQVPPLSADETTMADDLAHIADPRGLEYLALRGSTAMLRLLDVAPGRSAGTPPDPAAPGAPPCWGGATGHPGSPPAAACRWRGVGSCSRGQGRARPRPPRGTSTGSARGRSAGLRAGPGWTACRDC